VSASKHKKALPRTVTYDLKLLFPVLFLVGIGIVMVYSASSTLAMKKYGSDVYFLKRQALFALIGAVAMVVGRHFPFRMLRALVYPLLILAAGLLLAVQISGLGISAGGSTRWLSLGGFSFQPSEVARLAMIVFLAYSLSRKQEQLNDIYIGFLPHLLVLGVFTALILWQPDFGSVVILIVLTWLMLFIGGVPLRHLLSPMVLIVPLLVWLVWQEPYRLRRVLGFLDPWKYSSDIGYQLVHSFMAFGTGGLWGTGIGNGYQKLFYLPEPHTDFIFSVIGEELGLVGTLVILFFYGLILWRGLQIAANARDAFGSLVASGLTLAIALQVCVNMGVALGLLPTKGLTLPFLSYGGTSLLINMVSVGVLLNISADAQGRSGAYAYRQRQPGKRYARKR
jgi:cell division protein FtsW